MSRAAKKWQRTVAPHFGFLEQHGFRLDHVDDSWWAETVVYLSDTLGVEVTRSVEFRRVEIELLRLIEGRWPPYEVWVTESPINRVLFDNVLLARASHIVDQLPRGLSKSAIDDQLRLWADLLRTVAPEFLQGDDSAMLEGEQIIRNRVAENPQMITIWLPSDASAAEEAEAREKAERTSPPEVSVITRRYAR